MYRKNFRNPRSSKCSVRIGVKNRDGPVVPDRWCQAWTDGAKLDLGERLLKQTT